MLDPVEGITVSRAERENRDDFLLIFRGGFNAARLPPRVGVVWKLVTIQKGASNLYPWRKVTDSLENYERNINAQAD